MSGGPAGARCRTWASISIVNRDLHPRERDALDGLLAAEFAGARELRAQTESVLAASGTLIVDLVVDESLPRAVVSGRVPVEAAVDGAGHAGGLMLWVDDGRLSALEYWWVTQERPDGFPPASAIGVPVAAK
jgi:hypothetical protein